MKNLFLIIFIVAFARFSNAQVSTTYKTTVENIFQVNRSYVTTGLLKDYGFFYTNVEKFNGVRSDTRTRAQFKNFSTFIKAFS